MISLIFGTPQSKMAKSAKIQRATRNIGGCKKQALYRACSARAAMRLRHISSRTMELAMLYREAEPTPCGYHLSVIHHMETASASSQQESAHCQMVPQST